MTVATTFLPEPKPFRPFIKKLPPKAIIRNLLDKKKGLKLEIGFKNRLNC